MTENRASITTYCKCMRWHLVYTGAVRCQSW